MTVATGRDIEVDQLDDIATRIRVEWTEIEGALASSIARAVTIGNPHTFRTRFGTFGRAFVPAKTGAA